MRSLDSAKLQIKKNGIDRIQEHVSRFGEDKPNEMMIERLRKIANGAIPETTWDRNFYAHELREYVRYRRNGFAAGIPDNNDARAELWNNAHSATCEDYGVKDKVDGKWTFYHPDTWKFMEVEDA